MKTLKLPKNKKLVPTLKFKSQHIDAWYKLFHHTIHFLSDFSWVKTSFWHQSVKRLVLSGVLYIFDVDLLFSIYCEWCLSCNLFDLEDSRFIHNPFLKTETVILFLTYRENNYCRLFFVRFSALKLKVNLVNLIHFVESGSLKTIHPRCLIWQITIGFMSHKQGN